MMGGYTALALVMVAALAVQSAADELTPFQFSEKVPKKCLRRIRAGNIPDLGNQYTFEFSEGLQTQADGIVNGFAGFAIEALFLNFPALNTQYVADFAFATSGGRADKFALCTYDLANYPALLQLHCTGGENPVEYEGVFDVTFGNFNKRSCNPEAIVLTTRILNDEFDGSEPNAPIVVTAYGVRQDTGSGRSTSMAALMDRVADADAVKNVIA